ncbi:unnamed protein product [Mytilus edulis]|uniref:Uncharacterized protein n=1 Tax=Mytilus edulis TaxID=6550 RepID=A0A8S3PPP8_MYTED|nr:unnamed protein product [Mytilus edulis]
MLRPEKEGTEIFLAKAKYAFVPVKSFQPRQENMRFGATVQREVHKIGKLLTESEVNKGQQFRDSAARYTPENFWEWRNLLIQDPDTWRVIHRLATLLEYGIYSSIINQKLLTVHKLLGLLQRTWEQNWDPDTWRVIHRGDITGIWNILLNYKSEIVNCTQVAGLLQRTWEQNWNSIEFAILLCQARLNLLANGISELKTFENVDKLLKQMENSVPKESASVFLVSRIPATGKDFEYDMRKCIIPTWKAIEDRLSVHENPQIAIAHVNAHFVQELKIYVECPIN